MSRLDELIAELCPNGVEYRKLGELSALVTKQTGFDYTNHIKSQLLIEHLEGSVPYIQTKFFSGRFFNYDTDYFVPRNIVEKFPKITLNEKCLLFSIVGASIGNVGLFPGDVECFLGGAICVAKIKHEFNVDFLYYCIEANHVQRQIRNKTKGAGQATITVEDIREFTVPFPPLPVQEEIVRILDTFTELTAELTAELTVRKKQYEHYRDVLLKLEGERITIQDLFETRNGFTPSKDNPDFWEGGSLPWFKLEDIKDKGRELSDSYLHITEKALKKTGLFPSDSIIISTSATIGEYALITVPFLCNQRFTCLTLRDRYKKGINIRYLMHYCPMLSRYCKEHLNQGNFASVDMKQFIKFEFVIPPIEEQNRIVQILDSFDNLCNDLSSGLPAEIEARQKQYEYYRDRLLSFKELRK